MPRFKIANQRRSRSKTCTTLLTAIVVAGVVYATTHRSGDHHFHLGSSHGGRSLLAAARSPVTDFSVRPVPTRLDLAALLQEEGAKVGIELGVQQGGFARHNLDQWPACEQYHLVDIWRHQENYTDLANVDQSRQDAFLQDCRNAVEPFKHKIVEHRMYTTDAVKEFADGSADFIYVDARHDYCGVREDVEAYWPKLRPGGIMAGHDYLDAGQVRSMTPEQDWSLCHDGRKYEGAVRQAVDDWARREGLPVTVTYWNEAWPSWIVRKPRL